jgi:hypothetical protein
MDKRLPIGQTLTDALRASVKRQSLHSLKSLVKIQSTRLHPSHNAKVETTELKKG